MVPAADQAQQLNMAAEQPHVRLPEDAKWIELTDEVLEEHGDRWCTLVDTFKPYIPPPGKGREDENREGEIMAEWLRGCVHEGRMMRSTRAVYNEHLLGFFAVDPDNYYEVSNQPSPLLAARRILGIGAQQRGLLITSIVRSDLTPPGFGRCLIEEAVGLALEIEENTNEKITALLVEPANDRLTRMWQEKHHFDELTRSDQLHLPLKVREEL
jgi:hypothetical protein